MDPIAIPIIALLFVAMPAVILSGIRSIKREKYRAEAERSSRAPAGEGMRASELKALVRAAVDEATAPLAARITDLEERLGDEPVHALRERIGGSALADAFDPDAEFDDPSYEPPGRSRART